MKEKPGAVAVTRAKAVPHFWIKEGCDYKVKTTKNVLPPCIYCKRSTQVVTTKEIELGGIHKFRVWPLLTNETHTERGNRHEMACLKSQEHKYRRGHDMTALNERKPFASRLLDTRVRR